MPISQTYHRQPALAALMASGGRCGKSDITVAMQLEPPASGPDQRRGGGY